MASCRDNLYCLSCLYDLYHVEFMDFHIGFQLYFASCDYAERAGGGGMEEGHITTPNIGLVNITIQAPSICT